MHTVMMAVATLCDLTNSVFIFASAFFRTLLATYTGVLIGATAIPAWFLYRTLLPIHFGNGGIGVRSWIVRIARTPNRSP